MSCAPTYHCVPNIGSLSQLVEASEGIEQAMNEMKGTVEQLTLKLYSIESEGGAANSTPNNKNANENTTSDNDGTNKLYGKLNWWKKP